MPQTIERKIRIAEEWIVMFMLLSFLGWAVETLLCSLEAGKFCERGLIRLPLCTIYGFTILGVYWLLGTPQKGGKLLKKVKKLWMRIPVYFVLSASFTTATELVTGFFFTEVCGISLWDYSGYRYHYQGYICLEFFTIWGILLLFGMGFFFEPMRKRISELQEKTLFMWSVIPSVGLVTDWLVSFSRIIWKG